MLVRAPDSIHETIILSHDANSLVCIARSLDWRNSTVSKVFGTLNQILIWSLCGKLPTSWHTANIDQIRRYRCIFAFILTITPELDIDVLTPLQVSRFELSCNRDRLAIEVFVERDAGQFEECRHNVSMCRWVRLGDALFNIWTSDEEWYINIFFGAADFPWRKAMVANVESCVRLVQLQFAQYNVQSIITVICGIDDIRILKSTRMIAHPHHDGVD